MHPLDDAVTDTGNWRAVERRKSMQPGANGGWTMAREIIGTIIGMLAVCVPLGVALVAWGTHVESSLSTQAISIDYIHQEAKRMESVSNYADQRIDQRLVRIESKIDDLKDIKARNGLR